jgi:eukaryotic-like serine/threonine-protein kinase
METLLKPGQTIQSSTGASYSVQELLGSGGQGDIYRVNSGGKDWAIKWFFPFAADEQNFQKITKMIRQGPPDHRFRWPVELVSDSHIQGFGYVIPFREKRFKNLIDVMKRKVDPSFFTLITAAINMTECIRSLHIAGWYTYEISLAFFDFDPKTGDVYVNRLTEIIDPSEPSTHNILYSRRFSAPELVRHQSMPSVQTDLYSLSVVLFYLFFISHPLEGKKELKTALMDSITDGRLYGIEPVFIFDPDDDSNRPDPLLHRNALAFWKVYPAFFKDMFTRSFTAGIKDPDKGRLKETEWREGLIRLRDSIIYCQNCQSENFFDPLSCTDPDSGQQRCWYCNTGITYPLVIKISDRIIPLNSSTKLFTYHLDGTSFDNPVPFARVRQHPENPDILGLQNLSGIDWIAIRPDGSRTTVSPAKSITIAPRLEIQFGEKTGVVVSNNHAENNRQEIPFVDEKR